MKGQYTSLDAYWSYRLETYIFTQGLAFCTAGAFRKNFYQLVRTRHFTPVKENCAFAIKASRNEVLENRTQGDANIQSEILPYDENKDSCCPSEKREINIPALPKPVTVILSKIGSITMERRSNHEMKNQKFSSARNTRRVTASPIHPSHHNCSEEVHYTTKECNNNRLEPVHQVLSQQREESMKILNAKIARQTKMDIR